MLAARRAVTSWHRKWRSSLGPLAEGTFSSARWLAQNFHESTFLESDDDFPHAETSAAGAARYRRLAQASAASQIGQIRLASTKSITKSRRKQQSSFLVPFNAEIIPPNSLIPPASSDHPNSTSSEWYPPEYIHHFKSANTDPQSLAIFLSSQDRRVIARASIHVTLMPLYDYSEAILRKIREGTISDESRMESSRIMSGAVQTLLRVAADLKETSAAQTSQDRAALAVVLTTILQAQLGLRLDDFGSIFAYLDRLAKAAVPLPLHLYHRLACAAGQCSEFQAVQDLYDHAHQCYGGTDEWMLYARARAWAGLGKHSDQLRRYWTLYETEAPMASFQTPKPAQPNSSEAGIPMTAMLPPRYLFVFLLKLHLDSRFSPLSQEVIEILHAMQHYGHTVDTEVWLMLIRSSPSLRHHLDAVSADSRMSLLEGGPRSSEFIELLQSRAERLAVRDVFRLLRFLQIDFGCLERRKSLGRRATFVRGGYQEGQGVPAPKIVSRALLGPEETRNALAIVAEMFGRLAYPHRALAIAHRLSGSADGSHGRNTLAKALAAVIRGFTSQGRSDLAIAAGLATLGENTVQAEMAVPRVDRLTPIVFFALIRAAAELRSFRDKIAEVRRLMDLPLQHGLQFKDERPAVHRALASLLFAAIGSDPSNVDPLRDVLSDLKDVAARHDSQNPAYQERLRYFLSQLRAVGLEDTMSAVSRRRTNWLEQRESRVRRRRAEQQSIDWVRSDDLQQDLSSSSYGQVALGRRATPVREPAHGSQAQREGESTATSPGSTAEKAVQVSSHSSQSAKQREKVGKVNTMTLEEEMQKPLTPAAYALRLHVYSVIRGDHRSAAHTYQSMLKHGLRPSTLHITPIVEGLAIDGQIDEARSVVRATRRRFGFLSTPRLQAVIIRELMRVGRPDDAASELRQWVSEGGVPDEYIYSLLRPIPKLADPGRASAAFGDARRDPLSHHLRIDDVDEAYRYLWNEQRYHSAQKLLLMALCCGLQPDWEIKRLLSTSGNWLRKMQRKAGVELDPEADPRRRYERLPSPESHSLCYDRGVYLPYASLFEMPVFEQLNKNHWENEQSIPAVVDAYALNCEARYLALHVIEAVQKRDAAEMNEFRQEVKKVILEFLASPTFKTAAVEAEVAESEGQVDEQSTEAETSQDLTRAADDSEDFEEVTLDSSSDGGSDVGTSGEGRHESGSGHTAASSTASGASVAQEQTSGESCTFSGEYPATNQTSGKGGSANAPRKTLLANPWAVHENGKNRTSHKGTPATAAQYGSQTHEQSSGSDYRQPRVTWFKPPSDPSSTSSS